MLWSLVPVIVAQAEPAVGAKTHLASIPDRNKMVAWESLLENTSSKWTVRTGAEVSEFELRLSPNAVVMTSQEGRVMAIVDSVFVAKVPGESAWRTAYSTKSKLLLQIYRQDILESLYFIGMVMGAGKPVSSLIDSREAVVTRSSLTTVVTLAAAGGAKTLYTWSHGGGGYIRAIFDS